MWFDGDFSCPLLEFHSGIRLEIVIFFCLNLGLYKIECTGPISKVFKFIAN